MQKKKHAAVIVCVSCILLFLLGLNIYFHNRVIPNVYMMGSDVSGMTYNKLQNLAISRAGDFESRDIEIQVNDPKNDQRRKIITTLNNLGVNIDGEETARVVYETGKSGNFGRDLAVVLSSPFVRRVIPAQHSVDFSKLSSQIDLLAAGEIQEAKNATITFDNEPKVVSEADGWIIDKSKLASDLREQVNKFSGGDWQVELLPQKAQVTGRRAARALEKVKLLNQQRLVLFFNYNSWPLSGRRLLSILKFYPKGIENGFLANFATGDSSFVVKSFKLGDSQEAELNLSVDENELGKFVSEIGKSINQNKVDATLSFSNGKVREFTPAQDGQELDVATTFGLVRDAVSVDNVSAERDLAIKLPVKIVRAKIANDEINSLGIKELIGRGVSYFAGSIPNRIYNITLGAGRVNGTLVKSGETFSFNNAVGEVSGTTGYKQAYVISAGRTVLDDGGGICQVSTTIFRAALNSGLPITARTAHAYRVGYYEQNGFKPGMDATVWAPAVDFAFANDTDHYILVQTLVDTASLKLQVDIYGTSDGRKVKVSDPVVTNIVPAPSDKFVDDPTLPKGIKKQVDFAALGATSLFTRKVYKGDKVLIDESYKSVYRPWQAVYLVGTGG